MNIYIYIYMYIYVYMYVCVYTYIIWVDFYPAIHEAAAYDLLSALLSPAAANASIRARVCNLVGNGTHTLTHADVC